MGQPKISVIMPSLNVRPYIEECIESAINQTLKDIEIICVDAGSTDGTLEVLRDYEKRDSRIRVIVSDKKSYGRQMNLGFDAATGEYMAILETDDYIKPDMYAFLYAKAKEYDVDLIKSDHEIFTGEPGDREFTYRQLSANRSIYNRVIDPSLELVEVFKADKVTWTGIYKMSFLREHNIRHNETPGAAYQDNGFWFQTFLFAERVFFVRKAFYMLRRDNPNSSVFSHGKAYIIFDEYAFIERILRNDKEKEEQFITIFQKKKFDTYLFHYSRIAEMYKLDYLRRMATEFGDARARGELDESVFPVESYKALTEIIDHTEEYNIRRIYRETGLLLAPSYEAYILRDEITSLKQQLELARKDYEDILHSLSFKVGRLITFLPRKARGMFNCCRESGVRYTCRRVLIHLHLIKEDQKANQVGTYQSYLKRSSKYLFFQGLDPSEYENALKAWFKRETSRELNLDHPATYDEKIQWMKLHEKNPLKTQYSDKYEVRDFVRQTIGDRYLIPLLGVWERVEDIDFDTLPDKFVLKATHGSHWNIIVRDKRLMNVAEVKKKLNYWLSRNYAYYSGLELHYKDIKPRIIAEQYMENFDGELHDYKVWCFSGKAHYIQYITGRDKELQMAFYDLDWNKLPFISGHQQYKGNVERPANLDEMIQAAETLAEQFNHVRVDFYSLDNGDIKFGEMTFTPASGKLLWNPPEYDRIIGDLFDLEYPNGCTDAK